MAVEPFEINDLKSMERISVPDHFADKVMERIAIDREGGFKTLPSYSKLLILALVIVVYSSLGVFIGMQSYRSFGPDKNAKRKQALMEFRDAHHLNPIEKYDQLFRPFLTSK